jgi:hypothetical protein
MVLLLGASIGAVEVLDFGFLFLEKHIGDLNNLQLSTV